MNPIMWMVLGCAISMQESSNNPLAYNEREQAFGIKQVRQGVLTDVNERYHLNYTLKDMYVPEKAHRVFVLYVTMYDSAYSYESAAKCWNAGPGWKHKKGKAKARVEHYWADVRGYIERQNTRGSIANKNQPTKKLALRSKRK